MKIMICDHDSGQIKLIKNVISNYRFKHIVPKQGVDIFQQILNQKPSILIFNENFNKDCGIEFLNKLRSHPVTEHIPIIFISKKMNLLDDYNEFSNDSLVQLMQAPYRIKYLRHYISRWTTFRSLYIKQ